MEIRQGFYDKYIVQHADGSPIDLGARYFVLRYDNGAKDARYAQSALYTYARLIYMSNPQLAQDIYAIVAQLERESAQVTDE